MARASSYETAKAGKMPPFGKQLAARLAHNNIPEKIIICVGADAWRSAKHWNSRPEYSAMVLPPEVEPESLHWPVKDCYTQIDWDLAAPAALVMKLVACLLKAGAKDVLVCPLGIDYSKPAEMFNIHTQQWEQVRERIMIFYPDGDVHVFG